MYVKIHNTGSHHGNRTVVAVCDEDLLGKSLKEKNIEIKVTEHFYKGEPKNEQEVIIILKQTTNINLIGKKAVTAGLKAGVITKTSIMKIQGVPHAQAFVI